MKILALLFIFGFDSHAGIIESRIDDHKALIKHDTSPLKVGDKVIAYKKECKGFKAPLCKNVKAGQGVVTEERPDQHYEVQFEDSVKISEVIKVDKL